MIIYKFGGTSLGSAERMQQVAKIVSSTPEQKVVVLSAVSGTTNSLVEISELFAQAKVSDASNVIAQVTLLLVLCTLLPSKLFQSSMRKCEVLVRPSSETRSTRPPKS